MSVFTDMFPVTLMVNKPIGSATGQLIDNYTFKENIDVAIYKNDSFKSVGSVKYQESTHNGLTFFKGLEEDKEYQLNVGMSKYQITDYDTTGRFTTLLLKRLDFYGG